MALVPTASALQPEVVSDSGPAEQRICPSKEMECCIEGTMWSAMPDGGPGLVSLRVHVDRVHVTFPGASVATMPSQQ